MAPIAGTDDRPAELARIAEAPGAVPPTGGVPPEDAPGVAACGGPSSRLLADELVDGLDLLVRATRATLGSVDLQLEHAAQRAIYRLRELTESGGVELPRGAPLVAEQEHALAALAAEFGAEIDALARHLARRIEAL